MKFTFIQEEGINYSGEHCFGDPKDSLSDYYPLVKYELSHYILDNFFHLMNYTITEDNFIQISVDFQGHDFDDGHLEEPSGSPVIRIQYKRNGQELKTQLLEILEKYFDSFPSYLMGKPFMYTEGSIIAEKEFNDILQSISDKSKKNRKEATESKRPVFADTLEKYKLDPQPYGSDTITWLAICPRCRRHLLRFRFGELNGVVVIVILMEKTNMNL